MIGAARLLPWALLLLVTLQAAAEAAAGSDGDSATAQRTRYSARCHMLKDIDSCTDAVRWSPGDPALIVALADALVSAGRLPEALRDYRRAKELDPTFHGIDEKIDSAQAKSMRSRAAKKLNLDRVSAEQAAGRHYSNSDPEAQSH
jgi:tetratricopeptide (TPR) repeat protein